nr:hypothetical protein [Phenylobacterium sp.]
MKTPHLWFAVLAGAALAAVPAAAAAAKPAVYTVTLQQMAFGPLPARLRVGDIIEWVNNDIFVHSATARDKAFDVELKPGAHLWTTFRKAGTFPFACRYHPGMTGTLVVTGQAR